jgi:hypothetical protein
MYKIILLAFLVTNSLSSLAQTKGIKLTDFPYIVGYEYTQMDSTIVFDKYGFQSELIATEYKYSFKADTLDKRSTLVTCDRINKLNNIKLIPFNFFMQLSPKGYVYWFKEDGAKKSKKSLFVNSAMVKNTKWSGFYQNTKCEYRCITTDTLINTYLGKTKCFGVSMTQNTLVNGYDGVVILKEFYHPILGKVCSIAETYYLDYKGKKYIRSKSTAFVTHSNIPEEKKKSVEIVN